MSRYKAIIFDLDGVICSTDKFHFQAWKKIADDEGIYFDEVINNRLRGVSRMESLNIILERANRPYDEQVRFDLAEKKNDLYKSFLLGMSQEDLSEEVHDTLKVLCSKGIKLAIGSSSKNAKIILKRLQIENLFDEVSDGTNISNSKPDPEVFLMAAQFLRLEPKDCLVVEDAKSGILAAYRGGFDSAGIGEAAESKYVTYKMTSIRDILELVDV